MGWKKLDIDSGSRYKNNTRSLVSFLPLQSLCLSLLVNAGLIYDQQNPTGPNADAGLTLLTTGLNTDAGLTFFQPLLVPVNIS